MADKEKQLEIVERLQEKWLNRMEYLFDTGEITSTDMATLVRWFTQNGWTLDRSRLPQGLKDKLTANVDPKDFEDSGDVLPFRREA